MQKTTISLRLGVICMAAASVGFSMAIFSIFKLLLVICGRIVLLFTRRSSGFANRLSGFWTPYAVLVAVFAFSVSLLWTVAPPADALGSLAKYGKLITILLMLGLIRSRREAQLALASFVLAQAFLLASSWMFYFHLPGPWATSNMALPEFAVFSSYLDQGIMGAVLAAVCWYLPSLAPGRFGKPVVVVIAAAAIANVLFVLSGRSGHVVAIALLSLAIMWELPRRLRLVALTVPFFLVLILFLSSTKVRERLMMVETEVTSYSTQMHPTTSSGIRLGFWRSAVQIIAENPAGGAGIGDWNTEYNRLQRRQNPAHVDIAGNGNPDQEYLLWRVQLGIPGIALFCALLLVALRDSLKMEQRDARAFQSVVLVLSLACAFNASIYDALIGEFFCVLAGLLLALGAAGSASPHLDRVSA